MSSKHQIAPTRIFLKKLIKNVFFGFLIIVISLLIGMIGYRNFEKMSWVDSYENASMILSGMGPAEELSTTGGKIFAGTYTLSEK